MKLHLSVGGRPGKVLRKNSGKFELMCMINVLFSPRGCEQLLGAHNVPAWPSSTCALVDVPPLASYLHLATAFDAFYTAKYHIGQATDNTFICSISSWGTSWNTSKRVPEIADNRPPHRALDHRFHISVLNSFLSPPSAVYNHSSFSSLSRHALSFA
ncbi:hypothetical protein Tco_0966222 [Tanacetum coccineum]